MLKNHKCVLIQYYMVSNNRKYPGALQTMIDWFVEKT